MLAKQNSKYQSFPNLELARTPLKFLAELGITNFQLLLYVLAAVNLMQMVDSVMLPSVFKALEENIEGVTPMSLAFIATSESIANSIFVVVWGVLADRGDKLNLLKYATMGFAITTLATASVQSVACLALVRIASGVVGAALAPLIQGVIGVACPAKDRGGAFGLVLALGEVGKMLGLFIGGTMSHWHVIGGWRGAFALVSFFTFLVGCVLYMVQEEVRYGLFCESRTWAMLEDLQIMGNLEEKSTSELVKDVWCDFLTIIKRPSFCVLLLQGAFACIALKALLYQTMWAQYMGFSDVQASTISACFPLGCMCGAYVSGMLSDTMARRSPDHGRIMFGQSANLMTLLMFFLIYTHSNNSSTPDLMFFWNANLLNFLCGLFAVMSYASVIKPIYVEIVPPNLISQVVAMAAAVDGATSSLVSMPLLAYITESWFGYRQTSLTVAEIPLDMREANARALEHAMGAVTITAFLLMIVSFSFLHLTYPYDRNLSLREEDHLSRL